MVRARTLPTGSLALQCTAPLNAAARSWRAATSLTHRPAAGPGSALRTAWPAGFPACAPADSNWTSARPRAYTAALGRRGARRLRGAQDSAARVAPFGRRPAHQRPAAEPRTPMAGRLMPRPVPRPVNRTRGGRPRVSRSPRRPPSPPFAASDRGSSAGQEQTEALTYPVFLAARRLASSSALPALSTIRPSSARTAGSSASSPATSCQTRPSAMPKTPWPPASRS